MGDLVRLIQCECCGMLTDKVFYVPSDIAGPAAKRERVVYT